MNDRIEYETLMKKSSFYNTDKFQSGNGAYIKNYIAHFKNIRNEVEYLLELGIREGGSLELWKEFFPSAKIAGLDVNLPEDYSPSNGISVFQGKQQDEAILHRIFDEVTGKTGFNVIIDDCSHTGLLTKLSFNYLFVNCLKPGGIYVIEDYGTGYWDNWVDGKGFDFSKNDYKTDDCIMINTFPSHNFGMVGFVKQLIDNMCLSSITRNSENKKKTKVKKICFLPGQVFIYKTESAAKSVFSV